MSLQQYTMRNSGNPTDRPAGDDTPSLDSSSVKARKPSLQIGSSSGGNSPITPNSRQQEQQLNSGASRSGGSSSVSNPGKWKHFGLIHKHMGDALNKSKDPESATISVLHYCASLVCHAFDLAAKSSWTKDDLQVISTFDSM
ncbi:hypothetical protein BC829DRAFT_186364 [Chytridium lagenaria]|nr:hypothetical protein BC829DRAFT_186364 [Chytridium lagenaria]